MADYSAHYKCPCCGHRLFWRVSVGEAPFFCELLDLRCLLCARLFFSWERSALLKRVRRVFPVNKAELNAKAYTPRSHARPAHLPEPVMVRLLETV